MSRCRLQSTGFLLVSPTYYYRLNFLHTALLCPITASVAFKRLLLTLLVVFYKEHWRRGAEKAALRAETNPDDDVMVYLSVNAEYKFIRYK